MYCIVGHDIVLYGKVLHCVVWFGILCNILRNCMARLLYSLLRHGVECCGIVFHFSFFFC